MLCKELTHWKRPWCWERLRAGGEGDDREWDGWLASPTQWTWIWVDSDSWWCTGRPGVLQSMGSPRVKHDSETKLNWISFCYTLHEISNSQHNKQGQYWDADYKWDALTCRSKKQRILWTKYQISTIMMSTPFLVEISGSESIVSGFPGCLVVKNLPASAGDASLISGSERSPGGGNGNPLQYSCLENPMDRGAWQATVQRVTKSWTWLSKPKSNA